MGGDATLVGDRKICDQVGKEKGGRKIKEEGKKIYLEKWPFERREDE